MVLTKLLRAKLSTTQLTNIYIKRSFKLPRLFSAGFASPADFIRMSDKPGLAEEGEMCSFLSVLHLPGVTSFLLQVLIFYFNRSL